MGFSSSKESPGANDSSDHRETDSDNFPEPADGEFELPPSKRQRVEYSASHTSYIHVPTLAKEQLTQSPAVSAAEPEASEPPKQTPASRSDDKEEPVTESVKNEVRRGEASIKPEYLLPTSTSRPSFRDDDEAEASKPSADQDGERAPQGRKKQRGQNKARTYGTWGDSLVLCNSRALKPEFSPDECPYPDKCKHEHDLRKYLEHGKADSLTTFDSLCPVFEARGFCPAGWKCRFIPSHSKEVEHEDGRTELVLVVDEEKSATANSTSRREESGVFNAILRGDMNDLWRKRVALPKSDAYLDWTHKLWDAEQEKRHNAKFVQLPEEEKAIAERWASVVKQPSNDTSSAASDANTDQQDNRATYLEPPLRPSEKRRLYYGPETPILAPLTTQGNLPFRRLCVSLGAEATFSEMAVGAPLINGQKNEWALVRAHESEVGPPRVSSNAASILPGYDNSKDLRFGVQIAAGKPWMAVKAAEVLAKYCPRIRCIDLNAGCPIDLICRTGAGSALLDAPAKLEKILRGMHLVSDDIPITVKLRMGTRDNKPNALSNAERLIVGGHDSQELGLGGCGVAAITLHGRSRQQRYSRSADWSYIAQVSAMVQRLRDTMAEQSDTASEVDERNLPNGGKVWFVGNGDCYSHEDYFTQLKDARVDSVMIGRGALIKPWVFEEIATGQHLDKSSSERLEYIKTFVKHGLDCWGSDEIGVGKTRRFLLEWLSFTCRYIPIGLLERLPPKLNERPPSYHGRDELETLLASTNYRDWIKISEMFLGKAHEGFRFIPKHKSNSYETEG